MNPLACPLLLLSFGQAAADEFEPQRPSILQPPPVSGRADALDRRRPLQLDDFPSAPLPESGSLSDERYAAPQPPPRPQQPQQPRQPLASERRSVQLAERTEPVVPVHSDDAVDAANQILGEALRSIDLPGKSTPLVSVLGSADSTVRSRALKSYWNLSVAIGQYACAEHEALYLQRLSQPKTRTDDVMLRAQVARASARRSQARLNAIHWQERLSESIADGESALPVPADPPFIGVYRTQIDKLYGQGQAPRRLQQIDRTLPHELDIISRRAESIGAFERLVVELREAYEAGAVSLSQVLQASNDLGTERAKFLEAVLSYNANIADYSLAVVAPSTPAAVFLGTLIHTETAAQPALLADSRVRRASAEAPAVREDAATGFAPSRSAAESPNEYRPRDDRPLEFRDTEADYSPAGSSILQP